MPPYSALILEDDAQAAASVAERIGLSPFAGLIESEWVSSPAGMRDSFEANGAPDILVADIEMPDGCKSGIQAVKELVDGGGCGKSTQVIYATGYAEYCTDVYETEHVYFLLKPIDQPAFDRALSRAVDNIEACRRRRVALTHKGSTVFVDPSDVEYVESRLRKLVLHSGDDVYETYGTMAGAVDILPGAFVRCHKSFVVNMDAVRKVDSSRLVLRMGRVIPLGKRYRDDVKQEMACYYSVRIGKPDA